jgi:uracil-DNA glycosylase
VPSAGRPRCRRSPRPAGHVALDDPEGPALHLFGCFHVSQRNTFTGRLTPEMLREVLRTAAGQAGLTAR